jgi:dCTP deaminase
MAGLFPQQMIAQMFAQEAIRSSQALDEDQIQPASLDLRLGEVAHRIRASFLPGPEKDVMEPLKQLELHSIDLRQGAVLETGCVYLVPLLEELALPEDVEALTNPKSSTGRLDVFTRVITDKARSFDQIASGYRGKLYLEIAPRTFPILVRTGSRLTQMRLRRARGEDLHQAPYLSDEELKALHGQDPLVAETPLHLRDGVCVSVDLKAHDDSKIIGYRAKRHTGVVDVDVRGACALADYWEPLYENAARQLILDPDEFYILVSREALHVPPDYAAEMVPFDPLMGEFRVHYAGFFDPGFGHNAAGSHGAHAVLEVRSREVPFILDHGQSVGRLMYEPLSERPDTLYGQITTSNYQNQRLKLSKHFM